jgi:hypothetical protein
MHERPFTEQVARRLRITQLVLVIHYARFTGVTKPSAAVSTAYRTSHSVGHRIFPQNNLLFK